VKLVEFGLLRSMYDSTYGKYVIFSDILRAVRYWKPLTVH